MLLADCRGVFLSCLLTCLLPYLLRPLSYLHTHSFIPYSGHSLLTHLVRYAHGNGIEGYRSRIYVGYVRTIGGQMGTAYKVRVKSPMTPYNCFLIPMTEYGPVRRVI